MTFPKWCVDVFRMEGAQGLGLGTLCLRCKIKWPNCKEPSQYFALLGRKTWHQHCHALWLKGQCPHVKPKNANPQNLDLGLRLTIRQVSLSAGAYSARSRMRLCAKRGNSSGLGLRRLTTGIRKARVCRNCF